MMSNMSTSDDRRVATDARTLIDVCSYLHDLASCNGIQVVREHDAVTDENPIAEPHPFTDEGVTLDLASLPDHDATRYLHERADKGAVTDLAAEEIHELGKWDTNIAAQLDVRVYHRGESTITRVTYRGA